MGIDTPDSSRKIRETFNIGDIVLHTIEAKDILSAMIVNRVLASCSSQQIYLTMNVDGYNKQIDYCFENKKTGETKDFDDLAEAIDYYNTGETDEQRLVWSGDKICELLFLERNPAGLIETTMGEKTSLGLTRAIKDILGS